jgi:hypothetical protein
MPGSEHQAYALAERVARKAYALDSTLRITRRPGLVKPVLRN